MVGLDTSQPLEVEIYYDICSSINWHNRRGYDDLKLEKKLGTHYWDHNVNMSIFGVSVVDTYNIATKSLIYEDTSNTFFCYFSEVMTDNAID